MKKLFFATALVFTSLVHSQETQKFECNFKNYTFENVEIQVTPNCSISVSPGWGMEIQGRKRSYTFAQNGFLMVFVSTKDSERLSQSTGSNSYFLRPSVRYQNTLEYDFDENIHVVTFTSAYGIKVEVDTKQAHILSIDGYRIDTRPLTHISDIAKNRGHITVEAFEDNILFDHGWRTGEVSISQLQRAATVSKGHSKKCAIKNSDVLKKDPTRSGEVLFTLDSYQDALSFYKKKC